MRYLNFSRDVLIFTDSQRLAGAIIDDSRYPKGHPVTSGFLRLLEDAIFDPDRARMPSYTELERISIEPDGQVRDLAGMDAFLATSPSIGWTEQPGKMGDIASEEFSDDTVITLDGNAVWCPAGVLATRRSGTSLIRFAVSPMDLRGSVEPDQRVLASPVSAAGPGLRFVTDSNCGVCGVCGVCAICEEINAAAPAGAISAITAMNEMQDMLAPADRRALLEQAARTAHAATRNATRIGIG